MIYDLVLPIGIYQLVLITGFWLFRSDLKADFNPAGLWA